MYGDPFGKQQGSQDSHGRHRVGLSAGLVGLEGRGPAEGASCFCLRKAGALRAGAVRGESCATASESAGLSGQGPLSRHRLAQLAALGLGEGRGVDSCVGTG